MDKKIAKKLVLLQVALIEGADSWAYDPFRDVMIGFYNDESENTPISTHYWLNVNPDESDAEIRFRDYWPEGHTVTACGTYGFCNKDLVV